MNYTPPEEQECTTCLCVVTAETPKALLLTHYFRSRVNTTKWVASKEEWFPRSQVDFCYAEPQDIPTHDTMLHEPKALPSPQEFVELNIPNWILKKKGWI